MNFKALVQIILTPFIPIAGFKALRKVNYYFVYPFAALCLTLLLMATILTWAGLYDTADIFYLPLYLGGFVFRLAIMATVLSVIISKFTGEQLSLKEGFAIVGSASLTFLLLPLLQIIQPDIAQKLFWVGDLWFGLVIAIGIKEVYEFGFLKALLVALGIVATMHVLLLSLAGVKL